MYSALNTPTLGTLEHHIMMDNRLSAWQRDFVIRNLRAEVGQAPASTPLAPLLGRLGGGVLGWLVSKYFSMGPVGQMVGTAAGYGIGKVIADFYNDFGSSANMVQPW